MNLTLKNRIVVTLDTFDKAKKFVNTVSSFNFNVDAIQGRYTVDAKSVMGIFSLNLLEPITIEIDSSKLEEIREFNGKMREFI